jgi:hypothetical protein
MYFLEEDANACWENKDTWTFTMAEQKVEFFKGRHPYKSYTNSDIKSFTYKKEDNKSTGKFGFNQGVPNGIKLIIVSFCFSACLIV